MNKDKIKISPSRLEERIFNSNTELNNYLTSAKAKAGQDVTLLDSATGKYKTYLIQGTKGHFEIKPMGAGDYMGDTMPSIAEGDTDTNYYVYDSEDDIYKHYRFNGMRYVIVGSDNKKAYVGESLPAIGDTDIDYYIGNETDGFIHYRYFAGDINNYIAVGGDSYTKAEVDNLIAAKLVYYYFLSL